MHKWPISSRGNHLDDSNIYIVWLDWLIHYLFGPWILKIECQKFDVLKISSIFIKYQFQKNKLVVCCN